MTGARADDSGRPHRMVLPMLAADSPGHVTALAGQYRAGFETSAFTPCGSAPWSPAWLSSDDPAFSERYTALVRAAGADPRQGIPVRIVVDGRLALATPGQLGFGHLGQYRAQLVVERLIEMQPGGCTAGDAQP